MQELFEAIKNGDTGGVAAILAHHPEAVDARNENNLPAVLVAHYYGRSDLSRLLLENWRQDRRLRRMRAWTCSKGDGASEC
jgi:hypothetical protein